MLFLGALLVPAISQQSYGLTYIHGFGLGHHALDLRLLVLDFPLHPINGMLCHFTLNFVHIFALFFHRVNGLHVHGHVATDHHLLEEQEVVDTEQLYQQILMNLRCCLRARHHEVLL